MLAGRDDIRTAWVLCRRDLGELTARTTYEMQDILNDPAVDTVVEVMGGLEPAYTYVNGLPWKTAMGRTGMTWRGQTRHLRTALIFPRHTTR